MVCDEPYCSRPPFLRMVAKQDVCAGNDHECFGCIAQSTKDSSKCAKQDSPAFCVLQQDAKASESCDAVRDCVQHVVLIPAGELFYQFVSLTLQLSLQFSVAQGGGSTYGCIHSHAHLCLVDVLGAFYFLPFTDFKGVRVQILYCSEHWVGYDGSQYPASQQRCN